MTLREHHVDPVEVVAALRRHPSVRDAAVMRCVTPAGDDKLVGYVVPSAANVEIDATVTAAVDEAHIAKWRKLFEVAHSRPERAAQQAQAAEASDPRLNFSGWRNSYTGKPYPMAEMMEWLDQTVAGILRLRPQRVLEIGCGFGLLMFRIAPGCREYVATDLMDQVLAPLRPQIESDPALGRVKLICAEANDFSALPRGNFDVVVLNSVIQYFPGVAYLIDVIKKAAAAFRPGGFVLVGDVQNLVLLEAFQLSVLLAHAQPQDLAKTLRTTLRRNIDADPELSLSPAFFSALRAILPEVSGVRVEPRHGRFRNELTRLRFNAILRIGGPTPSVQQGDWHDWAEGRWTLDSLRRALLDDQPASLAFKNIPNARTLDAADALEALRQADDAMRVADFKTSLAQRSMIAAVDPQDLWDLEHTLPYEAHISWANCDRAGRFDALFVRKGATQEQSPAFPQAGTTRKEIDWAQLASEPARKRRVAALKSQLDEWLKTNLPVYMVPSTLVVLDRIPLTAAGTPDTDALPVPAGVVVVPPPPR